MRHQCFWFAADNVALILILRILTLSVCRDLETKIDQEKSRVSSNNHERIKADLEAIGQENAQLVAQIKAATAGGKAHK